MKVPKEDKVILEKINELFEELDTLHYKLTSETQEKLRKYHNEDGEIGHCIRWGLQGVQEILEELKKNAESKKD